MSDQVAQTPEITPQVVHLIDLLKRAKEGRLRVPRFQREFVWRRQDIVDLFDSIARQYPIGTLFLWGSQPVPKSRARIGPLVLPDYLGETWLVLDGQQRLTTLVGVLLADEQEWSIEDDDDPDRWRLCFDAESNSFNHVRNGDTIPLSYVPAPALLDTVKLFSQVEKMLRSAGNGAGQVSREDVFRWVGRAQEIARAIQTYRIPLVEIKTNNLSIAVESFSRLNKKGRSIGQDEMFSALTYIDSGQNSFHLAAEIDRLQENMVREGFGKVDRNILLRSVLTAANLDIYRTDWTRLGDQVRQDLKSQLPDAVNEAEQGLQLALDFLKSVGVLNARMLPYSMQLVALSAFFGRCNCATDAQLAFLKRWFWSSSFAGWFGSGNAALMRRSVDELRDVVSAESAPVSLKAMDVEQPALPIPLRFDMRSARVRVLMCVLLARGPLKPDGSSLSIVEAAELVFSRGPISMSTVCATVQSSDLRRSPANRVLDVAPDIMGQAKNWILNLDPLVRDKVLSSHGIDPDSFELLKLGLNDDFLQSRLDYLCEIEKEFMLQVGVSPPLSSTPALSPLDVDDMEPYS